MLDIDVKHLDKVITLLMQNRIYVKYEVNMAWKEKLLNGVRVDVKNNNIEYALKKFKRMVKDSGMMLELKKKSYYEKPSKVQREKKNLQILRYKYKNKKDNF